VEEATKGESPVEETPAPVTTREDAEKIERLRDDPRNAIYAKSDALKREKEAVDAEETPRNPNRNRPRRKRQANRKRLQRWNWRRNQK